MTPSAPASPYESPAWPWSMALLVAAYLFVIIALAGFATFGLHPGWVAGIPGAAQTYAIVYAHIGQVQVWFLWAILAAALIRRTGWRWVPAFLALYSLSFLSEFAGTSYGIPFGGYAYGPLLGPTWFDRVPIVIPLSWFAMALPSYALAAPIGLARGRVAHVALASGLLVAWDLALDPAMSALTPYWIWSESGPYYGMPWLNLLGWYLTALVLMGALAALRADRWIARIGPRWWAGYWGANLLMPLGMLVAAGMWPAVGASLVTTALLAALGWVGSLGVGVRQTVPSPVSP